MLWLFFVGEKHDSKPQYFFSLSEQKKTHHPLTGKGFSVACSTSHLILPPPSSKQDPPLA